MNKVIWLFILTILIFMLWTLFDISVVKLVPEVKHKILTNPLEFISIIKQNELALKVLASAFIAVVAWGIALSVKIKKINNNFYGGYENGRNTKYFTMDISF